MEQGARRHRAVQTEGPLSDVAIQVAPATEERAAQTDRAAGDHTDLSGPEGSKRHVRGRTRPNTSLAPGGLLELRKRDARI